MLTEVLSAFFHPDEFAREAIIQGQRVLGIWELLPSTVHHVQCVQFRFTCAQAAIPPVQLSDAVKLGDRSYRIVEMKSDGTGLLSLRLEGEGA